VFIRLSVILYALEALRHGVLKCVLAILDLVDSDHSAAWSTLRPMSRASPGIPQSSGAHTLIEKLFEASLEASLQIPTGCSRLGHSLFPEFQPVDAET
jgi:hypothetical protein